MEISQIDGNFHLFATKLPALRHGNRMRLYLVAFSPNNFSKSQWKGPLHVHRNLILRNLMIMQQHLPGTDKEVTTPEHVQYL